MYFSMFPSVIYTLDDSATKQIVSDFIRRITITEELKNNLTIYDEYDIKDGETPEIVASKVYNDSKLHWVILHTNITIDPRFDWPLKETDLIEYVKSKYGEDNIYSINRYEQSYNGITIVNNYNQLTSGFTGSELTNLEYEIRVNESKRRIKILKPRYISDLITVFEKLVKR